MFYLQNNNYFLLALCSYQTLLVFSLTLQSPYLSVNSIISYFHFFDYTKRTTSQLSFSDSFSLFNASCLSFCFLITFCLENSSLYLSSKASVMNLIVFSDSGIVMFLRAFALFCVLRIAFAKR